MRLVATLALAASLTAPVAAAPGPPVAKAPGLVVTQNGKIFVDGVALTKGTQPTWSPDESLVAFVRNGEIRVIGADGRGERRITVRSPGLHWPANSPAWSPDGTTIAFGGTRDIFTIRLGDRKLTNLTRSQRSYIGNFTPAYSPDGKLIAFARNTDAFNSDIFVMTPRGTHLRRVTKSQGTDTKPAEEHGPAWSPDGRTLVFVTNRDQPSFELYAIGVNGGNERRLTTTPSAGYDEDAPRFSRDGRRILYAHDGRIAVMNVDGSGVRELGLGTSADWRS